MSHLPGEKPIGRVSVLSLYILLQTDVQLLKHSLNQEFQPKSPSNSVVKLITFHSLPLHPSTRTLSMPGCHLMASRCPSHSCVLFHLEFCVYTKCLSSSLEKSKSLNTNLGVKYAVRVTLWYSPHILVIVIMLLPLSELCLMSQMRKLTLLPLLHYKGAFSCAIKSIVMLNNRSTKSFVQM